MTSQHADDESTAEDKQFYVKTDGIIGAVEVEISVHSHQDDEHVAELIHQDLASRAEEINQIVELGRHPDATEPPTKIDWEGWIRGDYDGVKQSTNTNTNNESSE